MNKLTVTKFAGIVAGLAAILAAQAPFQRSSNSTLYNDPQGGQLRLPQGWRAGSTPDHRLRALNPQDGSGVIIVPFISRSSCHDAFPQLLTPEYRDLQLGSFAQRRRSPDEAVVSFQFASGQFRGAALCSLFAGSGMIFSIFAPADRFDSVRQDLVRIASSFTVSGANASGPTPAGRRPIPIQFASWTDPAEGAFSTEVPAGWRIEGGTKRRGAVDVNGMIRMSSPDGTIFVFINDADLTTCLDPAALQGFVGSNREGQVMGGMLVLRYQPGVVFAERYVQMRLAPMIGGPAQLIDRRNRQDLNQLAASVGNNRSNIGEVSFQAAGGRVNGYVMAATHLGQGGTWSAGVLGYIAPPDRIPEALQVFQHALVTMRTSAAWSQTQHRTTGTVAGITARSSAEIGQLVTGSFWSTQDSYGRTFQSDSDANRGQVRLQDPTTGETFVAAAGKNYYWRPDGADERGIFGTNNTDRPNIDATLLLQVP